MDPVRDELLELAYESGADTLKSQDTTLGNLRTRASSLLTVATLLTSFSVSIGLVSTDQDMGAVLPRGAAWMLLLVLVALGGCVMSVLWPVKAWHFGADPALILERRGAGSSALEIRHYVATKMVEGIEANEKELRRRQNAFRWAAFLLLVEVAVLIAGLTVQY